MVSGFIQVLAKPLFVMDIGTIEATPYVFRSFVFQSHLLFIFMCRYASSACYRRFCIRFYQTTDYLDVVTL
jgi:hypothetical protein